MLGRFIFPSLRRFQKGVDGGTMQRYWRVLYMYVVRGRLQQHVALRQHLYTRLWLPALNRTYRCQHLDVKTASCCLVRPFLLLLVDSLIIFGTWTAHVPSCPRVRRILFGCNSA